MDWAEALLPDPLLFMVVASRMTAFYADLLAANDQALNSQAS
jgi:hypothetical protein